MLGGKLGRHADDPNGMRWCYGAAMEAFPSSAPDVLLPRDEVGRAHWLDGQALISVSSPAEGEAAILARPTALGAWRVEVNFASTMVDNAGFAKPGLKSTWTFHLADGEETFELCGGETLILGKGDSHPNEAEQLARSIAASMIAAS